MCTRVAVSVLTAGLLAGSAAPARAATWVEARSPHFVVYSDAGEKQARRVAWQYEQARETLIRLWPWASSELGGPVTVYAARDESSMRALVPKFFERGSGFTSVFYSADNGHYITLRLDIDPRGQPGVNPFITSYWSYVGLVLRASFAQELPEWMFRGMAEVFSNTIVFDDRIHVGQIIPWHLRTLRSRGRPTLEQLLAADRSSPMFSNSDRQYMFDATAWAFVHFLIFGNEGKNLPVFNQFAESVRRGAEANSLVLEHYGGANALRNALAQYIDRSLFTYQRWQIAVDVDRERFVAKALTPADAAIALARLYAATGLPAEARKQLAVASGAPASAEIEGFLLEREGKTEEAKRAYARASEAGAATYYGEYRLAALSWPRGEDVKPEAFEPIEKSLRRSVTLYSGFAPAYALLADALVSLKRHTEALGAAQRATTLEPGDVYAHLAMARALWSMSKVEEATAAAKRGLSLATTPQETKSARQLLDFLAKQPAPTTIDDQKKLFADCYDDDENACRKLMPLLEDACKGGRTQACVLVATFHAEGRGVAKDTAKAIALLEPLCKSGSQDACKLLEGLK